ncbi:MAG TPA: hypothetical protein DIU15_05810 [Deltaproteobacteria bacterium]|nr:hypothetical protein [Deltaproteobacteria bacterium]HCP45534.1 hypothetical protein [Deltaproteobacteria bacterium]
MMRRRWFRWAILAATVLLTSSSVALAAGGGDGHQAAGPDGTAIFRHLLNLSLLIALLVWALRTPMSDFLRRRQLEVRDQLDASANAKADAEQRYQEIETRLGDFQGELDKLMTDVREDAEMERRSIEARAEQTSTQLEAAAKRTVEEELRRARLALRSEAIDLAVGMAKDRLSNQVGDDDQKRLTDRYLDRVQETSQS